MNTRLLKAVVMITMIIVPLRGIAQTAEEKGLAIAIETDKRDQGFNDFSADLVMTLSNRHGQESTRSIRNRTLEVEADGDKSLVIYDTPNFCRSAIKQVRTTNGFTFLRSNALSELHRTTNPARSWEVSSRTRT